MDIDVIIISVLIVIAVGSAWILLRSGAEKNIYDPNDVDLSTDYDPKHDHFSKEHLEKLKQQEKKKPGSTKRKITPPAAVAVKNRESEIHSSFEGLDHLKKPVQIESQQTKGHKNRRESVDRRVEGRRHGERRSAQDRRA
ncbi:hypothetical protein D8Y20_05545 [Mariprofundus sp. EBB-1]|uniref:hypothetical protein n=1 Tax=Mariprofundus sp. EBB-1 TaxID=2650971 RepID=UPI000EF1F4A3|nr:hypothetical protein [Mariprofundus sp. EBB-1]RLL53304.1 hypothetical protein D8Y20_05545 [Mariprofundus sp. EBB-1]